MVIGNRNDDFIDELCNVATLENGDEKELLQLEHETVKV